MEIETINHGNFLLENFEILFEKNGIAIKEITEKFPSEVINTLIKALRRTTMEEAVEILRQRIDFPLRSIESMEKRVNFAKQLGMEVNQFVSGKQIELRLREIIADYFYIKIKSRDEY